MAEKTRVHQLANELGVSSKAILEKCQAEGLDVKNHMSTLSAGLEATIREWFSEGAHVTTLETTQRVDLAKVRVKPRARKKIPEEREPAEPEKEAPPAVPEKAVAAAQEPAAVAAAPPAEAVQATLPLELETVPQAQPPAEIAAPPTEAAEPTRPRYKPEPLPPTAEPPAEQKVVKAAGPQNIPAPAVLKGPRVVRVERPESLPPRPAARAGPPDKPIVVDRPKPPTRRGRGKAAPGRKDAEVVEETPASRARVHPRRSARASEAGDRLREWRNQDLIERQERLEAATGTGMKQRRAVQARLAATAPTAAGKKAKTQITEPITVREFCAATGIGRARVIPKLVEHGVQATITQAIASDLAELIALDFGVELEVIAQRSAMDELKEQFANRQRDHLQPKPPVVAFLGHVDHGKTSLLDRIRQTAVADGEVGGITQHIGAYQVERQGRRVTFIDTPGHEAFTAMRARGAQITDIVVLVVAADDGVMPQTVEAINHAKAAAVAIVVALNKIDLPGIDVNRIYSQLAEQGLVPHEWGGDVDVIRTSAVTGEGIEQLLEHLPTLSDLLELRVDPTIPATGVVVEAAIDGARGVVATLLIQDGTLREGDTVVCGPGCGRVRAMRDDRGRRVKRALPAMPVIISGLDELPRAGDRFYQIDDLKLGKSVAEERRLELRHESLMTVAKPKTLADLVAQQEAGEVPELNLILRADVQGSVEVLRKQLNELPTQEVHLRILHAGVGAITEGDVLLAQASSAIIIGFGIVADDRARHLAEQVGVEIRLYQIIYEMLDDIRHALEGLLAPEQRMETRGRAEIREIFNISRVGTVAGCMVVDGLVARNYRVRIIRDARVVRDEAQIESLRRFKDDVREVRAGLDCGIKIAGFDDIKPGDVIEAYEVVEHARSL